MNPASLFLAQLLGLYLLLIGILMMIRRKFFIHAVHDYIESRALRFVIPAIELIAGLALVLKHPVWSWSPATAITIVGWLMVLEPLAYFMIPEKRLTKWLNAMNTETMYVLGGLFSLVLGVILVLYGFQLS